MARNASAEYRFDVWTADSGLPQNSVRAIVQTRDGYLWVGTLDGLARFDGVRFTVFNKANSPGLSGNRVTALYEDPQGNLWIGLDAGGIALYHSGKFTSLNTGEGLPAGAIAMITRDELGETLVCVSANPFRWKQGKFLPTLPEMRTLFSPRRGGILCGMVGDSLQIHFGGKLTTLNVSNGLPSMNIKAVTADQYGNCWVSSEDQLVKIRDGKVSKIFTQQDGLPRNPLRPSPLDAVACEDRKGNVWINGAGPWLGRLKDGVFTGYPSSNTLSSHPLPLAVPGVAAGYIKEFFEDREGNLWIGTEGNGLIRAREQVVNVISTRQGLQTANIYPVYEDRAGSVWLGSWWRGPSRITSGVVTNFDLEQDTTAFCEDRNGRLWMGTIGGVAIFQDGKFSRDGVPSVLTNQSVSAICEDRKGGLWFGTERGLFCYRNGEVSLFTEKDGLPAGNISVIIEDRAGSLWLGSRGGLTRFTNGRFTTWTEQDGLPSNHIPALYEDKEGTLWIGSGDGGLARFKEGRFTCYTIKEGMFDNGVFQILEDASGNFWMSSNRGIHRVSKRELTEFAEGRRRSITSVAYGKGDGMLNAECNGGRSPAGVKTRDGKLWFPTQNGVAVIDPAIVPTNPRPPPVVIEAFILDRQPQPLDRPLRVTPGKSNLEIQYSGLSFINSERLSFKYKLAPTDDAWVEAGTRRAAYYSHLAPGHYTFNVLAANSDGLWNDSGPSLAFIVLPAWYQTLPFRASVVAAVCVVAAGLFYLRLRAVEWRRAAQETFSRELIRQQETERKRIAGELHDGLGQALLVIKNTASLASNPSAPSEETRQDLAVIANLSTKALEDLRTISHALRPPELDRLGLTKALEHAVHLVADAADLRVSAQLESLDGLLAAEAEIHLYRVVQECLNNIVKHAQASFIEVRAWSGDGYLHCTVRDNGEGFDPATRQSGSGKRRGQGLAGMTERVRLLGGQITIHSQPGSGTLVEAKLPLQPKSRIEAGIPS